MDREMPRKEKEGTERCIVIFDWDEWRDASLLGSPAKREGQLFTSRLL